MGAEDDEVQVSTLIYAKGSEAENIFKSFTFGPDEKEDDYNTVLAKYVAYFIPKKNVIHERACFHQRVQKQGEVTESCIKVLYKLSDNCDFGQSKSANIRDRLVVGIRNKELSKRMQLKTSPWRLLYKMLRQAEDVEDQMSQ